MGGYTSAWFWRRWTCFVLSKNSFISSLCGQHLEHYQGQCIWLCRLVKFQQPRRTCQNTDRDWSHSDNAHAVLGSGWGEVDVIHWSEAFRGWISPGNRSSRHRHELQHRGELLDCHFDARGHKVQQPREDSTPKCIVFHVLSYSSVQNKWVTLNQSYHNWQIVIVLLRLGEYSLSLSR